MIQLLLFLILFLILIGVLLSCTSKIVNAIINNAGKTQQQIQADTDEYLAFLKWRKTRRGRK